MISAVSTQRVLSNFWQTPKDNSSTVINENIRDHNKIENLPQGYLVHYFLYSTKIIKALPSQFPLL